MNSWTVSRRISLGFATLLLITAVLGMFALRCLIEIKQDVEELAENSLPSVLILNECAAGSRDNMVIAERFLLTDSEARHTEYEQQIDANRTRVDELFRRYERLISDNEDRRLFEEAKRTRAAYSTARNRLLELARQNKAEEARNWLSEVVVPAYETSIQALDADVEYNNKLGMASGAAGNAGAILGVHLIRIGLGVAVIVGSLLAWLVVRATNRVLRDVANNLDQGAIQTAAAARQVSASSESLSSGSSEQAASVEETSASLEEIASMIRGTAENAQKAKALAAESRTLAEAGTRTMVEMNKSMAEIDSSSAEVAKIVKSIDEIAFQTNILALNAAVEAARAGEAGAGFAVVADEVRSLAQRSAAAAKETADKIEAAITSSRLGSRSCAKVGESLVQIADKVSCTDSLVAEIATAAREQSLGIEQINIAIAQVDKATQGNSASAEESASAAEELDAQAESLKDMVAQLRQLVGGVGVSLTPSPSSVSRYTVFSGPPVTSSASHSPALGSLTANGRKGIPMPGNTSSRIRGDDDNFRNL